MKVTQDKFKQTLQRFAEEHMITKIEHPIPEMKSLIRFGVGAYMKSKSAELMEMLRQFILVCDKDGLIDMEESENAIMSGFKASGNVVSIAKAGFTFTFKPDDWSAFKRML